MLNINEHMVQVLPPQNDKDIKFIKKCFDSEDYKLFIAKEDDCLNDCYLLSYNNESIGLTFLSEEIIFGVRIIQVSIYIEKNSRMLSVPSIFATISKVISLYPDFDKIEFKVYGNNKRCCQLFNKIGLEKECTYCSNKIVLNKNIPIFYYSISNGEELDEVRNKISNFIQKGAFL